MCVSILNFLFRIEIIESFLDFSKRLLSKFKLILLSISLIIQLLLVSKKSKKETELCEPIGITI